jgi:hypothetical protein
MVACEHTQPLPHTKECACGDRNSAARAECLARVRKSLQAGKLLHKEAEAETHSVVTANRFELVTLRRAKVLGKIGKGTAT